MKYVIANWKMNLGVRESVALARGTLLALQGKEKVPEIILCPSFTALSEVKKTLARTRMALGAQNVGPGRAGAFTGEVGAAQLEDAGVTYVILGHSERRITFAEPQEVIAEKLRAVADSTSLTPILCVGEPEGFERNPYILSELKAALKGLTYNRRKKLMIAYEPVWAIGTGTPATPGDVIPVVDFIKAAVKEIAGIEEERVQVLYGGSVTAANAYAFLREPKIDGLLVGSSSLKMQEIHGIINAACDVVNVQDSVWH